MYHDTSFMIYIRKLYCVVWALANSVYPDQNAAFDQCLHCLHTVFSIKNMIKMKKYTRHPLNEKWTCPIKDGIVHLANKSCRRIA